MVQSGFGEELKIKGTPISVGGGLLAGCLLCVTGWTGTTGRSSAAWLLHGGWLELFAFDWVLLLFYVACGVEFWASQIHCFAFLLHLLLSFVFFCSCLCVMLCYSLINRTRRAFALRNDSKKKDHLPSDIRIFCRMIRFGLSKHELRLISKCNSIIHILKSY